MDKIKYSFVDEADVLERLDDNVELFERLFGKFLLKYQGSAEQIAELLADADKIEDARLLAHTVKGTSANLGLTKMWEAAKELELSIKEKRSADWQSLLEVYRKEMAAIVSEVEAKK